MPGAWLVVAAAVLWGTTGTAQALGPEASPLAVGSWRLVVAGVVLAAIALATRPGRGVRGLVTPLTLVAAAGMAAYQPFFFTAVDRAGVAVGTVVALGSAPVAVAALEAAVTRRRPTGRWVAATAPALLGLVLLGSQAPGGRSDPGGVLAALGAGCSYAVFTVCMARLARRGPAHGAAGAVFGLAALLLVPVALTQPLGWLASPGGVAMVAWLALGATVISYVLFTAGLRTTPAPTAATLTLAEPVTATVLAVLVLGERPGPPAWLGIALVVIGLGVAARTSVASTP